MVISVFSYADLQSIRLLLSVYSVTLFFARAAYWNGFPFSIE